MQARELQEPWSTTTTWTQLFSFHEELHAELAIYENEALSASNKRHFLLKGLPNGNSLEYAPAITAINLPGSNLTWDQSNIKDHPHLLRGEQERSRVYHLEDASNQQQQACRRFAMGTISTVAASVDTDMPRG